MKKILFHQIATLWNTRTRTVTSMKTGFAQCVRLFRGQAASLRAQSIVRRRRPGEVQMIFHLSLYPTGHITETSIIKNIVNKITIPMWSSRARLTVSL